MFKDTPVLKGRKVRTGVEILSLLCRRHGRHVADTCQCRQILADIACRCDTGLPNLYQLLPTSTNQPKHTGTLAIIEFLCLSSNNNHEMTNMSGIPRHVVKCRVVLDTLPTRHFLVSATWPATCRDMSPTRHRMSPFGQQKRHTDIRHMEHSEWTYQVSIWPIANNITSFWGEKKAYWQGVNA